MRTWPTSCPIYDSNLQWALSGSAQWLISTDRPSLASTVLFTPTVVYKLQSRGIHGTCQTNFIQLLHLADFLKFERQLGQRTPSSAERILCIIDCVSSLRTNGGNFDGKFVSVVTNMYEGAGWLQKKIIFQDN
jgi:hypothetical protein